MTKRRAAIMVREVGDEVLLLDTDAGVIHQLNPTASFIWRKSGVLADPEEIARHLVQDFDVPEEVALRDVHETLARLQTLRLITEP